MWDKTGTRSHSMNKDTTYIRDFNEKKADPLRARTQLPKKKVTQVGDTTYHNHYEKYNLNNANIESKEGETGLNDKCKHFSMKNMIFNLNLDGNSRNKLKFEAGTVYKDEYPGWNPE